MAKKTRTCGNCVFCKEKTGIVHTTNVCLSPSRGGEKRVTGHVAKPENGRSNYRGVSGGSLGAKARDLGEGGFGKLRVLEREARERRRVIRVDRRSPACGERLAFEAGEYEREFSSPLARGEPGELVYGYHGS